jgi:hypothetical protein
MKDKNPSGARGKRVSAAAAAMAIFWGMSCPAAELSHGIWVWHGSAVLAAVDGAAKLRDYCRTRGIDEVYVAVSEHGKIVLDRKTIDAIHLLHAANIRVEALLSSDSADEAGRHRDKLITQVQAIAAFNRQHPGTRFDGVHLDIEPQQRPENKGPGNLIFLTGLVQAYRAVRAAADGLGVDADIQTKLLKGSSTQRRELFESLPRLTLMLYELDTPDSQRDDAAKTRQVHSASQKFLAMAYADLPNSGMARLSVALRTPDYGAGLPAMLNALDEANRDNPRYAGWAQHAYNDLLPAR